jgi:hypothetical protein
MESFCNQFYELVWDIKEPKSDTEKGKLDKVCDKVGILG